MARHKDESEKSKTEFLQEQANEHAHRNNMLPAQALKAIKQADQIHKLIERRRTKTPLTEIEVINNTTSEDTKIILTNKEEFENALLTRNHQHTRQSLNTPFSKILELTEAIDPTNLNNRIEDIFNDLFRHPS